MKQNLNKTLLFILFISFTSVKVNGQLASGIPFSFNVTPTGAAMPLPVTSVAVPGAFIDEWDTLIAPAGWSFVFGGITYTKFVVSSNGWMALIPAAVAANPLPYPALSLPNNLLSNNTTGFPIIAPLWDDLSSSLIRYNVTAGTLAVQWYVKWQKSNGAAAASLFWVELNGNAGFNTIGFHYFNNTTYTPASPSASIGIAGICPGDFYSVSCPSAATATVDSVVENTNIGTGAANNFRPVDVNYKFTPYSPYDNCSGSYPAGNLGTIGATCTNVSVSTFNATPSGGAGNCGTSDVKDVWFYYIKPASVSTLKITTSPATCQSVSGTSIEVYTACGAGVPIGCSTSSIANPTYGEVTLNRTCVPETLWVRVTADGDVAGKFQICAKDAGGSGATCASARLICSLPYSQAGLNTAGSGNDYDSLNSVCHTIAMNGEDFVFAYTPPVAQCIQVSITSAGVNPSVFVFSGCPDSSSGTATYCLSSAEVATGTATINAVSLNAGQTYYIVVDNTQPGGIPFSINVTGTGTPPAYDICANAVSLNGGVPVPNTAICATTIGTYSTACATPTPVGQAGVPNCIPGSVPAAFVNGVTGDVWLKFTAGFTGSLQINTYQSAVNPTANAAMSVYTGACGAMGAPYACDNNSGPNGMPSLSIPVINGTTYYIRVWTENPEDAGNFDICFQGNCAPANDFPCTAVLVPLGGTASGFNTCASSVTEPVNAAQCVAGGTINTVWYKAVVPASGSIRVRTHPLTLTDTQIQGFLFPTGCANSVVSNVSKGCNDNGVACDGGYNAFSEQLYSGMLPGDTLFIALDGVGSLTGSFEISVIDGASTVFPPVNLQDCAGAQVLCSTNSIVVADPGFRNNGNICDLPSGSNGCWGIGERNSVWYQFTVDPALSGGTATIAFDVLTASSTDIDVLMWDVTGLSNACAQIQAKTLTNVACNYAAANNATGLTTTSPLPYGYSNAVSFSGTPRTYILLLNNYNSAANAGFTLNWNTTPISSTPTNAVWSGQTDTLFTTTTNWGACGSTPTCAIDAIVNNPANGRNPTVLAGAPAKSVRNITINAGATLRIKAGATLNVCGNFTNFGTLICEPTSTVQFIGSGLQTISGNLLAPNSFANLVINKPSGSVQLQSNIDVSENFTTTNITSIFDINGKYMKVGGNFTNFSGITTFTNIVNSTVEFNGSINQAFTNSNGSLSLYNVKMNKTGGKLYLNGANSNMNIDSTLSLTAGIISTRLLPALEVNMKNYLPATLLTHNATSYVDGNLRRKISNSASGGPFSPVIPASYDFPVGDSLIGGIGGYENANVKFTTSTLVFDLLAYFTPWPALPNPGPTASECVVATYSTLPFFNNGYWTIKRSTATFGGNYDLTLNNTGYTNNTGAGWTIAKAPLAANPGLSNSWWLTGTCFIGSTPASTQRVNMNSPARDSTSFNSLYATVQSAQPLSIELLSFTAEPDGEAVNCKWVTASETNNDYFNVERSLDGKEFISIGQVKGFGPGVSNSKLHYSLIDPDLCNDIRYYRLKQTDFDGTFAYSEIIALNCNDKTSIQVFPNPANSDLTCRFTQTQSNDLSLSIIDIAGRTVRIEKVQGKKGVNQVHLNIDDLSAGAYFLRISSTENDARLQSQFFKK